MQRFIVRLRDAATGKAAGSGVLYYEDRLASEIYVITAAHCLYEDSDNFGTRRQAVAVDVFYPDGNRFETFIADCRADCRICGDSRESDYAVLALDRERVVAVTGALPAIRAVCDRADAEDFVAMGFPLATHYKSVMTARARWNSASPGGCGLALSMLEDITENYTGGFSGGGLFARVGGELFLAGIFTRFLAEERGRMIYGIGLEPLSGLLRFVPLAAGGMTPGAMRRLLRDSLPGLGPHISTNFDVPVRAFAAYHAVSKDKTYIGRVRACFDRWLRDAVTHHSFEKGHPVREALEKFDAARRRIAEVANAYDFAVDRPFDRRPVLDLLNDAASSATRLLEQTEAQPRDAACYDTRHVLNSILYRCEALPAQLDETLMPLADSPVLLVTGEAGCGKSHLAGRMARQSLADDAPAMLFHGRDFTVSDSVERNVTRMLGATCTFEALLSSLDAIGRRAGRRVVIIIDALNETVRKEYWKTSLRPFVDKIRACPGVALVMTVRTTYIRETLPEDYADLAFVYDHRGFDGSEQQAVESFCLEYGLTAPAFPALNPEFANPLFLHIACKIATGRGTTSLMPGDSSLWRVFSEYPHYLDKEFDLRRDGLYDGLKVVSASVQAIAACMFDNNLYAIEYRRSRRLIADALGENLPHLLPDLVAECLLSKSSRPDNHDEYVRFTYQRLADFFRAEYAVADCRTAAEVIRKFARDEFKEKLRFSYDRQGIMEQLAIILPERFGIELWEALPDAAGFTFELPRMFLESLPWRSAASVDEKKAVDFLQKYGVSVNSWFNTLLTLGAVPGHPFNADRFHSIMMRQKSMAQRDALLQDFILRTYVPTPESDSAIRRLVDHAWSDGISRKVDRECARLAATALMWLLAATDLRLRDSATKALVNLLQHQPDALLDVMERAVEVDDPYVRERMYAVACGCALRTTRREDVERIARFVFDRFFKNGVKETHILMRDYAATTVEYALSLGLLANIDPASVRPPYGASMPLMPCAADMRHAELDADDKSQQYAKAHNKIFHSVQSDFHQFSKTLAWVVNGFRAPDRRLRSPRGRHMVRVDAVRRYIIERVFALGYDRMLHGEFDEMLMTEYYRHRFPQYHGGDVERIGKKYQRIALMEIAGCMADNFYVDNPYDTSQAIPYEGAWQGFLRDCDPVSITRVKTDDDLSPEDAAAIPAPWQRAVIDARWELPPSVWLKTMPGRADVAAAIERTDPDGRVWLTMYDFRTVHEPVPLGAERWMCDKRMMDMCVRAFIINKEDKAGIVRSLEGQNLYNLRFAERREGYGHLFMREKYWSAGSKFDARHNPDIPVPLFHESDYDCRVPVEEACGNIEDDNSGTCRQGYMPAEFLTDMLQLRWADDDMTMTDPSGTPVATGDPGRTECALMAREPLLRALSAHGLDIVWLVYTEKFHTPEGMLHSHRVPVPSGLYYYDDNGSLTGRMTMFER